MNDWAPLFTAAVGVLVPVFLVQLVNRLLSEDE